MGVVSDTRDERRNASHSTMSWKSSNRSETIEQKAFREFLERMSFGVQWIANGPTYVVVRLD